MDTRYIKQVIRIIKLKEGSAIIVKNRINYYEECRRQTALIQLTLVGIKFSKQNLIIDAIFCPPRHSGKEVDYKKFILHFGGGFIAVGDYNAKHAD